MATENRPKIELEWTTYDRILEGLAFVGLLFLVLLPMVYYSELPDTIPKHFNARGEADGYGHKATIWVVPFLGLALYILLSVLNQRPHIFNYAVRITPENAERQYRMATRLLRSLKLALVLIFTYLVWGIIQGARTGREGLSPNFVLIVIFGLSLLTIGYMIQSFRKEA